MNDLQQKLITGRGRKQSQQHKKRFDQCLVQIKTLRNKNNQLQKQCDNEIQDGIRSAIKAQATFISNEINVLKKTIEKLTQDYKDPASKQKIKDLALQASKEMERNKFIMADFVNRASHYSYGKRSSQNVYRKSRSEVDSIIPRNDNSNPYVAHLDPVNQTNSVVATEQMLDDIKYQQRMQAQRTAEIKKLQEQNNKINGIIKEMGQLVGGQQRDMVNQIDENLNDAHNNFLDANDELSEANVYQKKSRKKLICIVTTVIILVIAAAGMIYFLVAK